MPTSTPIQAILDAAATALAGLTLPDELRPADGAEGAPSALYLTDVPGLAYEVVEPMHLSFALWAEGQELTGRGAPGHILLTSTLRVQVTVCWVAASGARGTLAPIYVLAAQIRDALLGVEVPDHTPGVALTAARWSLRRHPSPSEELLGDPYLLDYTLSVRHQEG